MQKQNLLGKIISVYLIGLEKCHPILSGQSYKTESRYLDQIWEWLIFRNITFINQANMVKLQNRNFTCQYIPTVNHTELSNSIIKYNIKNISDTFRFHRGRVIFKEYTQIASRNELLNCKETPFVWNFIEENAVELSNQIMETQKIEHVKDLNEFEQGIIVEYKEKVALNEISDKIWSDGSFKMNSNDGGAAIVIECGNGEIISLMRKLPTIFNSTEAEMFGILMALCIASVDSRIKTILTDSKSIITISQLKELTNNQQMKEDNWTIRNRIRQLMQSTGCELQWIKAHSGIRQNELADGKAREANEMKVKYTAWVDYKCSVNWLIFMNNILIERAPRKFTKEINNKFRIRALEYVSVSYTNMVAGKTEKQIEYWTKAIDEMTKKYNISNVVQNRLSFILKLHTGMLPTNLRQFCWGFVKFAQCSLCDSDDDNMHFIKCKGLIELRVKLLKEIFLKCRSLKNKNNIHITTMLQNNLMNHFDENTALGFLPMEFMNLWESFQLATTDLVKISKHLIIVTNEIWKERCRNNQVKYEKCERKPLYGPKNPHKKISEEEIMKIVSSELSNNNIKFESIYW